MCVEWRKKDVNRKPYSKCRVKTKHKKVFSGKKINETKQSNKKKTQQKPHTHTQNPTQILKQTPNQNNKPTNHTPKKRFFLVLRVSFRAWKETYKDHNISTMSSLTNICGWEAGHFFTDEKLLLWFINRATIRSTGLRWSSVVLRSRYCRVQAWLSMPKKGGSLMLGYKFSTVKEISTSSPN